MSRPKQMRAGDALAMIIIALAALAFAITLKAPDLLALLQTLIGGPS